MYLQDVVTLLIMAKLRQIYIALEHFKHTMKLHQEFGCRQPQPAGFSKVVKR